MTFTEAPALPAFLARELPFHHRVFAGPRGRMAFIDEGHGRPVLMLHGNPTYGYLYRKMIPSLTERGFRCVVPDLYGFGFSDKPMHPADHTLEMHIESVRALAVALELDDVIIVGQDWGGPIVSGAASKLGGRVTAAVLGNTAVIRPARPIRSKAFHRFSQLPILSDLAFRGFAFPVPILFQVQGDKRSIGLRELRAYYHPFRMPWDRAGPLGLARMVPNREDHPSTAVMDGIGAWWAGFDGPVALVWGMRDPILGRSLGRHREAFPNATVKETEAGHFLQEEVPEELVGAVAHVADQSMKKSVISSAPGFTA
jgi:haloalkane dehalogenase